MIKCKNPVMLEQGHPTKCFYGKEGCCRHCERVKSCLSMYSEDDGYLCPYIENESDLECKCPFETR